MQSHGCCFFTFQLYILIPLFRLQRETGTYNYAHGFAPPDFRLFVMPIQGASNFLLRGQEKVTKEKATPMTRPAASLGSGILLRSNAYIRVGVCYSKNSGRLERRPAAQA